MRYVVQLVTAVQDDAGLWWGDVVTSLTTNDDKEADRWFRNLEPHAMDTVELRRNYPDGTSVVLRDKGLMWSNQEPVFDKE